MMRWKIRKPDPKLVSIIKKQFNTSDIVASVMVLRGIHSLEDSRPFFNPDPSQFHDPLLMKDMEKAVNRIIKNIHEKKPILVFGDYDVDGTTGASVLYLGLKSLGAIVETYIPHRETEGYGLSERGIDYAKSLESDLLITCDCGINAFAQVEFANAQEIDVIITDHHVPDKTLPEAFAVLNPKRKNCPYPFKGLCGCGVAFKLLAALSEQLESDFSTLMDLLDLVALATAADMVPIVEENRTMVHFGLSSLATTAKPGLRQLMDKSGLLDRELNVGRLVFGLAPKINAAGRMGDANRTVELLTTENETKAKQLASILIKENKLRQDIQQAVVDEALLMANAQVDFERENAIVLASREWHPGVVGIVASRLKDEFSRPAVLISIDENGLGKGSARSIKHFDLYEALSKTSGPLEGFGGHPMAAGLTVREENIDDFRRAFIREANHTLSKDDLIPSLTFDGEMSLGDIDARFMRFLEKLSPYGPGNMRPKFVSRQVEIVGNPKLMGRGDHIRFLARQDGRTYTAVGFNLAHFYEDLIIGHPVDLAYVVETNEWQGENNIQLNIRDIKISK